MIAIERVSWKRARVRRRSLLARPRCDGSAPRRHQRREAAGAAGEAERRARTIGQIRTKKNVARVVWEQASPEPWGLAVPAAPAAVTSRSIPKPTRAPDFPPIAGTNRASRWAGAPPWARRPAVCLIGPSAKQTMIAGAWTSIERGSVVARHEAPHRSSNCSLATKKEPSPQPPAPAMHQKQEGA
jgi:hypothetical protein